MTITLEKSETIHPGCTYKVAITTNWSNLQQIIAQSRFIHAVADNEDRLHSAHRAGCVANSKALLVEVCTAAALRHPGVNLVSLNGRTLSLSIVGFLASY
ncbi:unnamed protein product [Cercospora beticola]|nr:unnamed protein product [Cercospora beticola]